MNRQLTFALAVGRQTIKCPRSPVRSGSDRDHGTKTAAQARQAGGAGTVCPGVSAADTDWAEPAEVAWAAQRQMMIRPSRGIFLLRTRWSRLIEGRVIIAKSGVVWKADRSLMERLSDFSAECSGTWLYKTAGTPGSFSGLSMTW